MMYIYVDQEFIGFHCHAWLLSCPLWERPAITVIYTVTHMLQCTRRSVHDGNYDYGIHSNNEWLLEFFHFPRSVAEFYILS